MSYSSRRPNRDLIPLNRDLIEFLDRADKKSSKIEHMERMLSEQEPNLEQRRAADASRAQWKRDTQLQAQRVIDADEAARQQKAREIIERRRFEKRRNDFLMSALFPLSKIGELMSSFLPSFTDLPEEYEGMSMEEIEAALREKELRSPAGSRVGEAMGRMARGAGGGMGEAIGELNPFGVRENPVELDPIEVTPEPEQAIPRGASEKRERSVGRDLLDLFLGMPPGAY
tara:strand:- start:64 stop:750 length:687 start_codon:yes stop_codon:yes gene_type:complete